MTTTATTPKQRTRVEESLDVNLIRTSHFNIGRHLAKAAVEVNGLVAIDGPPGTGKTTCARYFAETIGIPSAIITMAARPAPLDMLRQTSDQSPVSKRPAPATRCSTTCSRS